MISFSQMTYRYLKSDIKKAILNIFGIILSISLITAIGTMAISYKNNTIENARKNKGDYHIKISSLDKNRLPEIEGTVGVDKIGVNKELGYSKLDEKHYVRIRELSSNSFNMLSLKIIQGRLPKENNEAIVEMSALDQILGDKKIGDLVKLPYGVMQDSEEDKSDDEGNNENTKEKYKEVGNREFKIVGVIEDYYDSNSISRKDILIYKNDFSEENKVDLYLKFIENKNMQKELIKVGEKLGNEYKIEENSVLINSVSSNFHSSMDSTVNSLALILISIIVVCTIAVIYNSFNISVLERIKQFGILRSVGGSPKHIKKLIIKESIILGLTGIPLGLISGVIAVKVVMFFLGQNEYSYFNNFKVIISPKILMISVLIGSVAIFLASIFPAIYASKVSPLVAVQNRGSIKEKEGNVKTNKLIKKIFKIEGQLAYKNLKRNKKKFRITSFSIAISVILFVVFHGFLFNIMDIEETYGRSNRGSKVIFNIYNKDFSTKGGEGFNLYEKLKKDSRINVDREFDYIGGNIKIPENKVLDKRALRYGNKDGNMVEQRISISSYEEEQLNEFRSYLESGSIDYKKMIEENQVLLLQNDYNIDPVSKKRSIIKTHDFKVGDFIEIRNDIYDKDKNICTIKTKAKICGILNKSPYGESYNQNGNLKIIASNTLQEKIINKGFMELEKYYKGDYNIKEDILRRNGLIQENFKDGKLISKNLSISLKKDLSKNDINKLIEDLKIEAITNRASYMNLYKNFQESNQMDIAIKVFIYGFIVVISLISSLNIINSVSTNIILRKREFAIVKAVGLGDRGIKKMVTLEGILCSLIGVLYGTIISSVLVNILNKTTQRSFDVNLTLPYMSILIATVSALTIGYLSTLIPLKKIREGNIVEDIKKDL